MIFATKEVGGLSEPLVLGGRQRAKVRDLYTAEVEQLVGGLRSWAARTRGGEVADRGMEGCHLVEALETPRKLRRSRWDRDGSAEAVPHLSCVSGGGGGRRREEEGVWGGGRGGAHAMPLRRGCARSHGAGLVNGV